MSSQYVDASQLQRRNLARALGILGLSLVLGLMLVLPDGNEYNFQVNLPLQTIAGAAGVILLVVSFTLVKGPQMKIARALFVLGSSLFLALLGSWFVGSSVWGGNPRVAIPLGAIVLSSGAVVAWFTLTGMPMRVWAWASLLIVPASVAFVSPSANVLFLVLYLLFPITTTAVVMVAMRQARRPPKVSREASVAAAEQPTNTFAILALVFGLFIGLLGVVFGHIALRQIRRSGAPGRGLAIAGLVLGYLWLAMIAAAWLSTMLAVS